MQQLTEVTAEDKAMLRSMQNIIREKRRLEQQESIFVFLIPIMRYLVKTYTFDALISLQNSDLD